MKIAGSVVLITGASQGIGEATAREFARRGASVVVAARNVERLQKIADEINAQGGRALAVTTDVRKTADIMRMVRAAVDRFGRIDVLINNAGIATPRIGVMETEDEALLEMFEVNLLGHMRCARAVVPHMRGHGGVIVNVGSLAGEIALGDIYSTTKFGVRGYSEDLRRALRHDNIAVVLIEPGFIRTSEHEPTRFPMPGPQTVARAIVRAVERPRPKIIVPWPYQLLVFATKLFPGYVDRLVSRRNLRQFIKEGDPSDARTDSRSG